MGWIGDSSRRRRRVLIGQEPLKGPGLWIERATQRDLLWPLIYALGFTLLAGLIGLQVRSGLRYDPGQVLAQPVVARVTFKSVDDQATATARQDAYDRQPSVYVPDPAALNKLRESLNALIGLGSLTGVEQMTPEMQKRFALDGQGQVLAELRRLSDGDQPGHHWKTLADQLVHELMQVALLDSKQADRERDEAQRSPKIVICPPSGPELDRYDNVILGLPRDMDIWRERVVLAVAKVAFPEVLVSSVVAAVLQVQQPLYQLDQAETVRRKEAAVRQEPLVQRTYSANTLIAAAGQPLTQAEAKAMAQEQQAYADHVGPLEAQVGSLCRFGLIGLVILGLWAYIRAYNPRIATNSTRGLAMMALLLVCFGLSVSWVTVHPKFLLVATALPTLLAAIILAIAYDQRLSLAAGSTLSLLVTLTLGLSAGHLVILVVGLGVAAAQLNEVRTRSKLVMVGLWSGLSMSLATTLVNLLERGVTNMQQWLVIERQALMALGCGLFTGLLVQGLLPAIESVFKVTTAMTLKELTDASHPLLRRLAQEAPGTYQHSLRLADIAQSAADAIGVNSLLCKVAALYHDVGKLSKPDYFIENQPPGVNRHAQLTSAMSHLVIVGHVKTGVEMARQARLPSAIRHFIESHHGTTVVEYFYRQACQQAQAQGQPLPSPDQFRYPGPKPQTREAAILMLADSCESAARTLEEPTPARLQQLVHHLAERRLRDGQFNECPLSLRELSRIEEAIIRTLAAIYHGRIKYPPAPPSPPAPPTSPHCGPSVPFSSSAALLPDAPPGVDSSTAPCPMVQPPAGLSAKGEVDSQQA